VDHDTLSGRFLRVDADLDDFVRRAPEITPQRLLTLAMGGIAMYFSWMDTHIGGPIKKILMSPLGGGAMLGMSGALGLWLGGKFGLS
jgi:hypothetical protein